MIRHITSESTSGWMSTADELTKLLALRDQGIITEEQFEAQKTHLLDTNRSVSASSFIPENHAPLVLASAADIAAPSSSFDDSKERTQEDSIDSTFEWGEAIVWGTLLLAIGFGAYMMIRGDSGQDSKSVRSSYQPTPQQIATQQVNDQKERARQKCRDTVQFTSKFPTKASFSGSLLSRDVDSLPGGGFTVRGRVELMNELGAMIPHTFVCTVGPDGKLKPPFAVTPG